MQNSFSKGILDSNFWRMKNYVPEIYQNLQKVDYQGAEGKSFFQILN